MIYKTVIVMSLLLLGNFAAGRISKGYEMGHVVPPTQELSATPMKLGEWQGADLPEDPRIRKILRAQDGIDRLYRNEKNQEILVHAVWTDDYIKLHFPQQCYRESGWELQGTKDVTVTCRDESQFPAKILTFIQDGKRINVLYWFQLGDNIFLDRLQHRLLRRKVCWGKKEWPPLMKFMLETRDQGLDQGEQALIEMASQLQERVLKNEIRESS